MSIRSPDGWARLQAAATGQLRGFHQIPPAVREEIVQEALLRTWSFGGVRHPRAFVRRTAHNLAVSWLRKARRQDAGPPQDERSSDGGVERIEAQLDVARAFTVLQGAPDSYHRMIVQVLQEVPMTELIEEALGQSSADAERQDWVLKRDALYKQRRRSLEWVRDRLAA